MRISERKRIKQQLKKDFGVYWKEGWKICLESHRIVRRIERKRKKELKKEV